MVTDHINKRKDRSTEHASPQRHGVTEKPFLAFLRASVVTPKVTISHVTGVTINAKWKFVGLRRDWSGGGTSVLAGSLQKAFVAVVLALALAGICRAQSLNSGVGTIALSTILRDSLSVNLSANSVNFALTAGSNTNRGNTSITATTTWLLRPGIRNVRVYAFFANSGSALTNGTGINIPSSDFQISDNAGPFTALTTTTPFGGANAGLLLSTTRIRRRNRSGRRTDTMNFNINLAPLPNLPAGTYNGTLTIQAQAI